MKEPPLLSYRAEKVQAAGHDWRAGARVTGGVYGQSPAKNEGRIADKKFMRRLVEASVFVAAICLFCACGLRLPGSSIFIAQTGILSPPASAVVINNVDDVTKWKTCTGACSECPDGVSCPGTGNANYNTSVLHPAAPSRDGSSAGFQIFDSPAWATALWGADLGPHNTASNFIWDFWVYEDAQVSQALEFDFFQAVGGRKFMFGSQCDVGAGWWDVWNGVEGHWIHTNVPCAKFTVNTWHHVTWYLQRLGNNTLQYVTLQVDGGTFPINMNEPSEVSSWGDSIGIQIQLDTNKNGTGYNEWIDGMSITLW